MSDLKLRFLSKVSCMETACRFVIRCLPTAHSRVEFPYFSDSRGGHTFHKCNDIAKEDLDWKLEREEVPEERFGSSRVYLAGRARSKPDTQERVQFSYNFDIRTLEALPENPTFLSEISTLDHNSDHLQK